MALIGIGIIIFFVILHFVIRDAVKEGTLEALKEYEKNKNK